MTRLVTRIKKGLYNSKLNWKISRFSFCSYWCISISAFSYLVNNSKGIMGSTIGLIIGAIIARIRKYKSIIKEKEKKHSEIVFLAKN